LEGTVETLERTGELSVAEALRLLVAEAFIDSNPAVVVCVVIPEVLDMVVEGNVDVTVVTFKEFIVVVVTLV
jgi:hypothetical protein